MIFYRIRDWTLDHAWFSSVVSVLLAFGLFFGLLAAGPWVIIGFLLLVMGTLAAVVLRNTVFSPERRARSAELDALRDRVHSRYERVRERRDAERARQEAALCAVEQAYHSELPPGLGK